MGYSGESRVAEMELKFWARLSCTDEVLGELFRSRPFRED